jgi:hypothetical protein
LNSNNYDKKELSDENLKNAENYYGKIRKIPANSSLI